MNHTLSSTLVTRSGWSRGFNSEYTYNEQAWVCTCGHVFADYITSQEDAEKAHLLHRVEELEKLVETLLGR